MANGPPEGLQANVFSSYPTFVLWFLDLGLAAFHRCGWRFRMGMRAFARACRRLDITAAIQSAGVIGFRVLQPSLQVYPSTYCTVNCTILTVSPVVCNAVTDT